MCLWKGEQGTRIPKQQEMGESSAGSPPAFQHSLVSGFSSNKIILSQAGLGLEGALKFIQFQLSSRKFLVLFRATFPCDCPQLPIPGMDGSPA